MKSRYLDEMARDYDRGISLLMPAMDFKPALDELGDGSTYKSAMIDVKS